MTTGRVGVCLPCLQVGQHHKGERVGTILQSSLRSREVQQSDVPESEVLQPRSRTVGSDTGPAARSGRHRPARPGSPPVYCSGRRRDNYRRTCAGGTPDRASSALRHGSAPSTRPLPWSRPGRVYRRNAAQPRHRALPSETPCPAIRSRATSRSGRGCPGTTAPGTPRRSGPARPSSGLSKSVAIPVLIPSRQHFGFAGRPDKPTEPVRAGKIP